MAGRGGGGGRGWGQQPQQQQQQQQGGQGGKGGEDWAGSGGPKDRDPPPAWDGLDPEGTFKAFCKDMRLWEGSTDIEPSRRGAKLLRRLTGVARAAVDDVEVEDILAPEGVKTIMTKLIDTFSLHLDQTFPRALEKAIYQEARRRDEGFIEYIARVQAQFRDLNKEGQDLDTVVKGYILMRHAKLSQVQDDQVKTWTQGAMQEPEVIKALRKLDKVNTSFGRSRDDRNFFENEDWGQDDELEQELEDWNQEDDYEVDNENYVYLADGDLQDVMEESDVLAALASYQEVRKSLSDQKKGRGFYKGSGSKGKGKGKNLKGKSKGTFNFGGSHGKGSTMGGSPARVHIDQIKMRTRCARCGTIGHWARSASGSGQSSGFFMMHGPASGESGYMCVAWLPDFSSLFKAIKNGRNSNPCTLR